MVIVMRLIDADALKEELNNWAVDLTKSKFPHYIKDDADCIIDTAPTVDAVPVVRCKDCEWYVRSIIKQDGTLDKRYKPDWCDLYRRVREETYFCADGERRDDED